MTNRKSLPAASIPSEGYDLIDAYAQEKRMSISEALRYICATSPELKTFAGADDLTAYFQVGEWGGNRRSKSEGQSDSQPPDF